MSEREPTLHPSSRTYTISGVLGQGGFGTVYHARMSAEGGFSKDVAIKILADTSPPPSVLARFRDEARILGLLRDQHIVSVDPPIELGGRWAVVMEFADGESCYGLMRHGPFPVRAALEVIREVARTLENIWTFKGPDGTPMQLLHRDIKPANLQITPNGDVKVLDFGVARARFEEREIHTFHDFVGTPGYIAPERVHGDEGPYGDVFSLGVVLHILLTNTKPPPPLDGPAPMPESLTTLETAAWRLAARMQSVKPEDRPDAGQVARQCDKLLQQWPGPGLRPWATRNVKPRPTRDDDELVGSVLRPEATVTRALADTPTQTNVAAMVMLPVGGTLLLLMAMLLTGLISVSLTVWWLRTPAIPPSVQVQAAPTAPVPAPAEPADPRPQPPPAPAQPADPNPPPEPVLVEPSPKPPSPQTPPRPPAPVVPTPTPPSPSVDPEPAEVPTPPNESPASVRLTGAKTLQLRGSNGTFESGSVPAGTYRIYVSYGDDFVSSGSVSLSASQSATIRCNQAFNRCVVE